MAANKIDRINREIEKTHEKITTSLPTHSRSSIIITVLPKVC